MLYNKSASECLQSPYAYIKYVSNILNKYCKYLKSIFYLEQFIYLFIEQEAAETWQTNGPKRLNGRNKIHLLLLNNLNMYFKQLN